jgi:hypothetical protein
VSQARVRSTHQRRGMTAKPCWPSGLRDVHHGGEDGAGPVDELAGEAAVGEDEPDRADQVRREQGGLGAVTVLHARSKHDDHDEQAQGVGDDEPLPLLIFLAS